MKCCDGSVNNSRKKGAGKSFFKSTLPGKMVQPVYEESDKLSSRGQGSEYELVQCPAYESTARKPQSQPAEDENSHYEL